MSDQPTPEPTEAELRAAYEAQIKQLRVDDLVIETVVSLVNLAGRKAGLAPGAEDERDLRQLALAIDGARALLPLVETELGPDASAVRDALSQLQLAYARLTSGAPGPSEPGDEGDGGSDPGGSDPEPGPGGPPSGGGAPPGPSGPPPVPGSPDPEGPGPAQRSGRLWVPGQ